MLVCGHWVLPECGSSLCRCLESWLRMVSLCVASSIPASFSSPSVTFSKPWGRKKNQAVWERHQKILKCLNIKEKHGRKKSVLHSHIPPDHNIHSLVFWCIGKGQSVSATKRWSDYSFLNCQEIVITYQHTCVLTRPCMFFCFKFLREVQIKERSDSSPLEINQPDT